MRGSRHTDADKSDATIIKVTHHAIERYRLRASHVSDGSHIAHRLRERVFDALYQGELYSVGQTTWVTPVVVSPGNSADRLWAIMEIAGPIEKPFLITICTVLTSNMAIRSFGHLVGVAGGAQRHTTPEAA